MYQEISQLVSRQLERHDMSAYKVTYDELHEQLTNALIEWAQQCEYTYEELKQNLTPKDWEEFEELLSV